MNDGLQFADIIILALVAGFVILRLRSVLGKHSDLPERYKEQNDDQSPEGKVIDLHPTETIIVPDLPEDDPDAIAGDDKELARTLKRIKAADPSFHTSQFLEGAKSAFEMVLDAYARDDRKTLKMLLAPDVHEAFIKALKQSEKAGVREETTLVSIESATLTEAILKGKIIRITVEFVSEQIHLTRNESGEIVEGNPSDIENIHDHWTFERNAGSNDPNWKLVATGE